MQPFQTAFRVAAVVVDAKSPRPQALCINLLRLFPPCVLKRTNQTPQVEKSPKPVASCAMPAGPGMKIKTDTPLVKKAREGVMEFLLVSVDLAGGGVGGGSVGF